jgi:dihydroorotate dehydrogenase (fumarate)
MSLDLTTQYLGLRLENPLVVAASPVTSELHKLMQLEQEGAAAAVMPSLFEEQIERESSLLRSLYQIGGEDYAESQVRVQTLDNYNAGVDSYLRHIEAAKKSVAIPIIGSLNGDQRGHWVRFAQVIQDAGADALELNIYFVPTDPDTSGAQVEDRYVELVAAVRSQVSIPLAVKIGPHFSSLPHVAARLIAAGANGLVLFNRFLQPDIDLATREVTPKLTLSSHDELRLPLRWIAILRRQVKASLAASSGIQTGDDVIKLLMAGADVTMLASVLIRNGPKYLGALRGELERRLNELGYGSIEQLKGSLSRRNDQNLSMFERANYLRTVTSPK